MLGNFKLIIETPPSDEHEHKPCHHHAEDQSNLGLEDEEEKKFNMVVNKFFQKEAFGKNFILTKEHHIHSNYRATCDQDSHFMVLNKKGFLKI